jgi:multidrug efflux system membrane fusion protein
LTQAQESIRAAENRISQAEQQVRQAQGQFEQANAQVAASQSRVRQARNRVAAALGAIRASRARVAQTGQGIKSTENRIAQAEQQVRQAQGQFEQANAQIKARRSLVSESKARIATATGGVQGAQAQENAARAGASAASAQEIGAQVPLSETQLKSPINGILLRRTVELGSLVGAPGSPGFTVADVSRVKVVVGVPSDQMKTIWIGMNVPVRVDVLGPQAVRGRITAISPAADTQTRLFNVEVTIPNSQRRLGVGMIATVEFSPPADSEAVTGGVLVPPTALVPDAKGYAVYTVAQQGAGVTVHRRPVRMGTVSGNQVQVQGVSSGEKVVTVGAATLQDGQAVRIAEGPESTEDHQDGS